MPDILSNILALKINLSLPLVFGVLGAIYIGTWLVLLRELRKEELGSTPDGVMNAEPGSMEAVGGSGEVVNREFAARQEAEKTVRGKEAVSHGGKDFLHNAEPHGKRKVVIEALKEIS